MTSLQSSRPRASVVPPASPPSSAASPVGAKGKPGPEAAPPRSAPALKTGHDGRSSFEAPTRKSESTLDKVKSSPFASVEPPKSKQEALARAENFLNPAVNTQPEGRPQTVTHDGRDENSVNILNGQQAVRQVQANETLEQETLAQWPPEQQQQYQDVKQAAGESPDPGLGQLALQKMLFSGQLPGEKDLQGGGTTLDHLAQAASGENLAEGIDKNEFTGSLTRELATPSSINQGARGTCAPTASSIALAQQNPAEYARIANGLASPEGKVTLADGKTTLEREPETAFQEPTGEGAKNSGRSIVQRIMAPALMEVANGERDYNDATGEGAGAYAPDVDVLNDALQGKSQSYQNVTTDEQKAQAMNRIDQELARDNNVLVGMNYPVPNGKDSGHELLVTGTSTQDGKDYVEYINPWGQQERMPREEFEQRLNSVHYASPSLAELAQRLLSRPSPAEAVQFI